MRNRSSDLRIPRSDTLPLSHRDSTVSEIYYEVHMTRVVHTARISNVDSVMFIARLREMVSFVLRKEIEEDAFRLVTSVGQRKNFESFDQSNLRPLDSAGHARDKTKNIFRFFFTEFKTYHLPYSIYKQSLKQSSLFPRNEVKADLSVKYTGTI